MSLVDILEIALLFEAIVGISLWIGWKIKRQSLIDWLYDIGDAYIDTLLEEMDKNPQKMEKFTKLIMKSLKIEPSGQKGGGTLNIAGFKIPSEIVSAIMGRFLPKAAETVAESNPFG